MSRLPYQSNLVTILNIKGGTTLVYSHRTTSFIRNHLATDSMDNDIKVRLGKRLGAGAFGEVFKAFDVRSQKAVAVKVIKLNKGDKDHETRVKREINAMSNLKNVSSLAPS